MRDLKLLETIPSKAELRGRIPRPERFRPEPRLLQEPELRVLPDGTGELLLARKGTWKHIHAMHVEIVRALEEGAAMSEVIERAKGPCPPKHLAFCETLVRRFVWQMRQAGLVEIPLEAPPEIFEARYRVLQELGRGGMGVVYLCSDAVTDELVVVKHAWGWTRAIEKTEHSVREEARHLALLDHPRIPPLLDVFERDGLLHMVRGYAPGSGLKSHAADVRALGVNARLRLLGQCAETLQHVHERGLLYLDVKPDNFIVDTLEAGPSLLDFGLCRPNVPGGLKLPGALGSPGYAAPEVVREKVATEASDVFGLGRMFTMLVTGHRLKFKHTQADVERALEEKGVARQERDVLVAMCADDPGARLRSMDEVLAAIA